MIDKRVIERQIRKGKLDAQAYRRTLEALPDVSDRVARDTDIEPARGTSAASAPGPQSEPLEPDAADAAEGADDADEDDEETSSDASAGY